MTSASPDSWAWVAGASEGLGLAFADALAQRGYNLVLIARRSELLEQNQQRLESTYNVACQTLTCDLAQADLLATLSPLLERYPPDIGVFNAAYAPIGAFTQLSLEQVQQVVQLNVGALVSFSHLLGGQMAARGHGALLLMSSLAGEQGSPGIATYAASKAFITRFAESLWFELQPKGVAVLVSIAGAISTPGYAAVSERPVPGTLSPAAVAERSLDALDAGPRIVPGFTNKLAALLLGRLLPRAWATRIMARVNARLAPSQGVAT